MNKNIFEINNLNFYYSKDKQALYEINMNIPEKKTVAFIGPSGCGKSTLLRIFNRIYKDYSGGFYTGEVYFDNKDLFDQKAYSDIVLRTKVGMILQTPSVFPMSIYENIALGLRNIGIRDKNLLDERVKQALIDAALYDEVKDKLNYQAESLSGGQKQRLSIARTIALRPEVLLMDEPTSSLDPIATQKIETLIMELKNDYTIILVTHSMSQAQRVSDYTAYFDAGKLIEYDKTRTIFTNPKKLQTKNYLTGKKA